MDKELREAVERLKIRSDIHPKDPDVSVLLDCAKRVLDAEEELPEKIKEPDVIACEENIGNDYFACGWNAAIDQAALVIAKNYRRVIELPSVDEIYKILCQEFCSTYISDRLMKSSKAIRQSITGEK